MCICFTESKDPSKLSSAASGRPVIPLLTSIEPTEEDLLTPSRELRNLLRSAQTEFRNLNRNRTLTGADRKLLKRFLLDRILAPRAQKALAGLYRPTEHAASVEQVAGQHLLTARQLEAWLKIDIKTIYAYARKNRIPHVTIGTFVRFPEREIRIWLARQSYKPRAMQKRARRRVKSTRLRNR